jgi:hypothetical protein
VHEQTHSQPCRFAEQPIWPRSIVVRTAYE